MQKDEKYPVTRESKRRSPSPCFSLVACTLFLCCLFVLQIRTLAAVDHPGIREYTITEEDMPSPLTLPNSQHHSNGPVYADAEKNLIVTMSDGKCRLWEYKTGKFLDQYAAALSFRVIDRASTIIIVGPSPSHSAGIRVAWYDIATKKLLKDLSLKEFNLGQISAIAVSDRGRYLAFSTDDQFFQSLYVFALPSGTPVISNKMTDLGQMSSLAFSPDEQILLSGSRNAELRLWSTATGRLLRLINGHPDWVNSVAFSQDGKQFVSGSHDDTIRVWDTATGLEKAKFKSNYVVWAVAISPDGQWLAGGSVGNKIKLWNLKQNRFVREFGLSNTDTVGEDSDINDLAFSTDSRRLAAASGRSVRIWDIPDGSLQFALQGPSFPITSVALDRAGTRMIIATGPSAMVLNTQTGAVSAFLAGHQNTVTSASFSSDGSYVVTGSWDQTIKKWNTRTGALVQSIHSHDDPVFTVTKTYAASAEGES